MKNKQGVHPGLKYVLFPPGIKFSHHQVGKNLEKNSFLNAILMRQAYLGKVFLTFKSSGLYARNSVPITTPELSSLTTRNFSPLSSKRLSSLAKRWPDLGISKSSRTVELFIANFYSSASP